MPVQDIARSIEYYCSVLGFKRDFGEETHAGHGSVTRGSVGIQFTQANASFQPESFTGWFYVFVEKIDKLYGEYAGQGVKITQPLKSHPHGMREFEIEDVNRYRFRFGQYAS